MIDGKLYAVGGLGYDAAALLSVERYDPATDEWRVVASMATATHSSGACGGAGRQAVCCGWAY